MVLWSSQRGLHSQMCKSTKGHEHKCKAKNLEQGNAALEQGRGSRPPGSPGTHYGSVNRVQVVGDWFPRPGHGALQWWQLHNPHDSANICGGRGRLGESSADTSQAPRQKNLVCRSYRKTLLGVWREFLALLRAPHRKQTCGTCTLQPAQTELLTSGQQNCVPHDFSKEHHMCVTALNWTVPECHQPSPCQLQLPHIWTGHKHVLGLLSCLYLFCSPELIAMGCAFSIPTTTEWVAGLQEKLRHVSN